MSLFVDISLIILLVIGVSIIMRLLKQPLIVGYIISGVLAGPLFLNVITLNDTFTTFSEVGIALLLFIVGLGLNFKIIREVGFVSLIIGTGQVLLTGAAAFGIMYGLGFSSLVSLYSALALAFSSTIIVVKLLSDKNSLETLYGRICMGILVVQDLVAILAIMFLSSFSGRPDVFSNTEYAFFLIAKGVGSLIILFIAGYFLLPRLSKFIAQSQEFLLVFSLGWCLIIASLFQWLGFTLEIGALLAGMTLSMTNYHHEISSKVKPIRDFFLVLFFIILGSQMGFVNLKDSYFTIIILTLFVILIKPLIIMIIMGLLGYTKRNSFMTGISLAQVSEFSFILITLGIGVGHLEQNILSIITIVGLLSITSSAYLIQYGDKLYNFLSPFLIIFERKGKKVDDISIKDQKEYDLILFGYNRIGYDILKSIHKQKKKCLVIDFNPNTIIELTKEKIPCVYGDAGDLELLSQLDFKRTKMVISTIPDADTNLMLLNRIRQMNSNVVIIVIAHQIDDALNFYDAGACYVLMPHFVGGNYISTLLEEYSFDTKRFMDEKIRHLSYLKKRKAMGHEHPRAEKFR